MRKYLLHNLLVLVGLLYFTNANAYDFEKDGIYYNILPTEQKKVEVTYSSYNKYSGTFTSPYYGDVIIPSTVEHNNQTYTVTKIGHNAFENRPSLTSVTLPETLDSIDYYSFHYCQGLNSIKIPENVKFIGNFAFYDCSGLISITIPESMTRIGEYAFSNCKSLSNITFPDNTPISVGESAFSNTTWWSNQPDGVVYLGKNVYTYKGTMPENSSIKIKEGTLSICDVAFVGCKGLTNLDLPNSLQTIGYGSFSNCVNLREFTLPSSLERIGGECFRNCKSITKVDFPESLKTIGSYAFENCNSITKIELPESLQDLGASSFYGCTSLKNVKLCHTITSIKEATFKGTSISSIIIPENIDSIYDQAFSQCGYLKKVEIKDETKPIYLGFALKNTDNYTKKQVADGLLSGCLINYLYVGRNIELIDKRFQSNNSDNKLYSYLYNTNNDIDSLIIGPNVSHIEYSLIFGTSETNTIKHLVFKDCHELLTMSNNHGMNINDYKLNIDSVYIGRDLDLKFPNSTLRCVRISGGAKHIINNMFSNCSALDSIAIESNIQTIGDEAFYKCSKLTKIIFPESLESIGNWAFCQTDLIDINIPNKVTSIGQSAFVENKNLINVSLGEKLVSIGNEAFYRTKLTSVIIPKNVTSIGDYAFAECKKLDKVFMKTSTAEVGSHAFIEGVTHRITYAPNTNYSSLSGIGSTIVSNLAVNIFEDGDYIYLPLSGTKKTCAIVDWKNHAKEKNIVIPSSIKFGKQKLTPIEIGRNTFYGCDITSLKLSDNITTISDNACNSCVSLKNVVLNDALTSIEHEAFYNCTALDTVYFGKDLKTIGASTFYGNSKIKNITLQDAVTSIGENAFNGCTDLTTITLGCNVAKIDAAAFANCANVTDIISYNPDAPVCVKGVFDSVDKFSCNVYVPKNSVDIYASATEWEDFFNLIEMPYEGGTQTITLNVSKYLWSTLILPFDAEIPAGLKVYDVYDTDETGCVPTEVYKIKANVPYLVKGIMGKYKFSGISKAIEETYSNGLLTGTHVSNYEAPIGSYVLQYHIGSGFAFYKVNRDGIMLPVNRCYLTKDASAAKFLVPFVTEETTGINDITNDVANTTSTIYTLDGKVVNASKQNQNGIFVVDGKKVIIK